MYLIPVLGIAEHEGVIGSGSQESTRATHGNQCRRTIERKVPEDSEKPQITQAEWSHSRLPPSRPFYGSPMLGTGNQGHNEFHIFLSSGLRGEPKLEARPSVGSTNLSRVPGTHRSAPDIPCPGELSIVDRGLLFFRGGTPAVPKESLVTRKSSGVISWSLAVGEVSIGFLPTVGSMSPFLSVITSFLEGEDNRAQPSRVLL